MNKLKFPNQHNLWFERVIAIIATANLALVVFDLSYIQIRDFYVKRLPQITHLYDPVKGIEPHRETKKYLETVDNLVEQVSETGLKSPQAKVLMHQLILETAEMINTNPFAGSGKSGTLETIKNRMRKHIRKESAKESFATFWSQDYLSTHGWNQEINFFDQSIRPLIERNYYRRIGENGEFIDYFWMIDLPFVVLFGIEFLGRAFYIRRQHRRLSSLEAFSWRWYDIFLILPFCRWLRIIPVIVRLHQSQLVDFNLLQRQINQGVIANFAEEITEIVVIRVINQVQGSISRGELVRWLSPSQSTQSYININNVNEVQAITGLLLQTILQQVLPQIQPEITAILRHNIKIVLQQNPVYRNFPSLPGLEQTQIQISEQLATQITASLYNVALGAAKDPVTGKLSGELLEKFSTALGTELQKKRILTEIQTLLSELLEELKINYIQQRLSPEDIDQIIQQTQQMRTGVPTDVIVDPGSALLEKRQH